MPGATNEKNICKKYRKKILTFKIDLKWFKDDFKQKKNQNFFRIFFFHRILLGGYRDFGVFFNFFCIPSTEKADFMEKIEKNRKKFHLKNLTKK